MPGVRIPLSPAPCAVLPPCGVWGPWAGLWVCSHHACRAESKLAACPPARLPVCLPTWTGWSSKTHFGRRLCTGWRRPRGGCRLPRHGIPATETRWPVGCLRQVRASRPGGRVILSEILALGGESSRLTHSQATLLHTGTSDLAGFAAPRTHSVHLTASSGRLRGATAAANSMPDCGHACHPPPSPVPHACARWPACSGGPAGCDEHKKVSRRPLRPGSVPGQVPHRLSGAVPRAAA